MHNNFDELVKAHPNCCTKSKVAAESGKRFEIVSKEDFTKIRIDDCLITSKQVQKCDFGFIRNSNNEFYFVELKGKDIHTAIDQIVSTIKIFESDLIKIPQEKRFGFIISSRNPKTGQETNNLKQAFAKKYGRLLEIRSREYKYVPK